jgi:MFS-type transporter involved in bile tolerance (Atg22 family)
MRDIPKGMLAGLAATVVLSLLMVMKAMVGLMPPLDIPAMLAGAMGSPDTPLIRWIVHLSIGIVVYGVAIGVLDPKLPGTSHVGHGVMLGVIGWLIMMVVLMPMAGAGLFGMNMGVMAPMMTLVLHLIFGAVLGWVYGRSAVSQDMSGSRAHA